MLAMLAATAIAVDTLLMVARANSPLPYWDQWDSLLDYQRLRQGDFSLGDLFSQHNEHRLAAPRLIFWADYALAGGSNKLNLAVIAVIQLVHAALLIGLARPRRTEAQGWIAAAVVLALLMSLGQWENFTWGFQSQFVGVFALATGAFILIARAASDGAGRRAVLFFVGLGLLSLATFTMANGLIAAAIAVVLCLAVGAPLWMTLTTAGYVIVAGLAYFHGYHVVGDHSSLAYALSRPVEYIVYCLSYLGNPVSEHLLWAGGRESPRMHLAASILGGVGVALSIAALVTTARRGASRDRKVLMSIILFVSATAAVTALGRLNFGIEQAYASRYHTPSNLFWAAHIVFWSRSGVPAIRRVAMSAAVMVVIALAAIQPLIRADVFDKDTAVDLAESALLSGVADAQAIEAGAYPQNGMARSGMEILRAYRVGVFTERRARWIGQDLSSVGPLEPRVCAGAFDGVSRSPTGNLDGLRVAGWAWDRRARRPAADVVLTDDSMRVVGVARTGRRRPDVSAALHYPWAVDSGWQGVVKSEGAVLRAFAVLHDGGVCAIGEKPTLPRPALIPIRSLSRADVGAAVASVVPSAVSGGGWSDNGATPSGQPSPPGFVTFGSSTSAANAVGSITFGPLRGDTAAVALGLITGADPSGLSIVIKDAQSGEVLSLRYLPALQTWTWLRFDLPASAKGKAVIIEAVDQGPGPDQWMGVTEPRALVGR